MKHILVVDDAQETLDLIQMVLSGHRDIQADYAVNSSEAIDLFNANSYNACILDVSLPDITGYYLGHLIKKVCPEMPLAFLTNYEGEFTKENAEEIDAEFWSKAEVFANPTQLVELISNLAMDVECAETKIIVKPELLKQIS